MQAIMSPNNKFRLDLIENWDMKKQYVLFIGLNPSTRFSGGLVTRCINLAKEWGYGGVHIMNLFPYRTPSPKELFKFYKNIEHVNPGNENEIRRIAETAGLIVACWGDLGTYKNQDKVILVRLHMDGREIYHLGLTNQGNPRHAAYVEKGVKPILWTETNKNG